MIFMEGKIPENDMNTEELLKRIDELSLKLSAEKARFTVASEYINLGIWEYDIATKTQYMLKKLAGKYSESLEPVQDFCDTVISRGCRIFR